MMTDYLRLLKTWRRLQVLPEWPIEKIHDFQLQRFKELIALAYTKVPVYRTFYKRYRIVQSREGKITFKVHLFYDDEKNRRNCLRDLNSAFSETFGPLHVDFVDGFSPSPTGKFKVIERENT